MSENKNEMDMASGLCKRLDKLKAMRAPYEETFQEILDYTFYNRQDFFSTEKGQRRDIEIFDTTGVNAVQMLASALHSGITPSTKRWIDLRPTDPELLDSDEVKKWTETSLHRMFSVFQSTDSNFAQQNHELLLDVVSIGTGCLYVDDIPGQGIRFITRPLSEIYVAENNESIIDTVFRKFNFTARQAVQEWGEENIGELIRQSAIHKPDDKFEFVHAVMPRTDAERQFGPIEKVPSKFKFIGFYVSTKDKKIVDIRGFNEQPYIVVRWEKLIGELYGRSPGWNSLADVKMINKMSETIIRAAEKAVDPPLIISDDGVLGDLDTFPGGVIYGGMSDDGRPTIQPLQNNARLDIGMEMLEQRRDAIRRSFFVDQFIAKEGTPLSATEFAQRSEDRLRLTGPQLLRLRSEYLSRVVNRVFNIMMRNGDFPPIPDVLEDAQLDIEYISPLAKSQRFEELSAFNRSLESIQVLLETNPEVLDNFNADWLARTNAEVSGVPANAMRKTDKNAEIPSVQELREERSRQQQQAQQQQQMLEGAGAAADLAGAGVDIGV